MHHRLGATMNQWHSSRRRPISKTESLAWSAISRQSDTPHQPQHGTSSTHHGTSSHILKYVKIHVRIVSGVRCVDCAVCACPEAASMCAVLRGHHREPRTGNFWGSDVFLHILFLDDHNFINNPPPDLKLVSSKTLMTRRAIFYNLH
jgi:hypothetical protein